MDATPFGYELLIRSSRHVLVRLRLAEPSWLSLVESHHHPRASSAGRLWMEPGFGAAHRLLYLVTWFDALARQGVSDQAIRRWFKAPQRIQEDQLCAPWDALSYGALEEMARFQVHALRPEQLEVEVPCLAHGTN